MKISDKIRTGLGVLAIAGLAACASDSGNASSSAASGSMTAKPRRKAVAVLSPGANSQVHGTVTFQEETEGVRVIADVQGLAPGKHGFHIHEKGDCSAPDFSSAGGHFNPLGKPHGAPTDPEHHSGDFGNLEANDKGIARSERVFTWLSFTGTNSILNHAVIIHEKPDDLKSQPSGNAGARLACGVIQSVPK